MSLLPIPIRSVPVLMAALLLLVASGAQAQVVAPERGVAGTALRVRQLDGIKRVLLIGAHPDDEDTSLIAALARGLGADVAYLSLTRGEGGQNLIGPELDEGLGIVRTGELLAARELDGGRQFFTRAFDFGYSKSAEETFRFWPREELLADVVWIVRTFRPQVIVSIFPPTPEAGHGHHQVAGIVALQAFEDAGDPGRFPEQLAGPGSVEPWTPSKLYRSALFDPEAATTSLATGDLDPVLGRSHFQLAMESRSQHRSQEMGTPQAMGPHRARLSRVRSRIPAAAEEIFAGVDTTLAGGAGALPTILSGAVVRSLSRYRALIRDVEGHLAPSDLSEAVAPLAGALASLEEARRTAGSVPEGAMLVRDLAPKVAGAGEALVSAAGLVVDARASADRVVPGEELVVEVSVWNGGPVSVGGAEPTLLLPPGWTAEPVEAATSDASQGFRDRLLAPERESFHRGPAPVPAGSVSRWRYRVRVHADAEPSRLYYLRSPRVGEMYRWPEDRTLWGLPRNPPEMQASVRLTLSVPPLPPGGPDGADVDRPVGAPAGAVGESALLRRVELEVHRPVEHVGVDEATGEFHSPVLVVPALSVRARPDVMAWPLSLEGPRTVSVTVRSHAREGVRGRLSLEAPGEWRVEPTSAPVDLNRREEAGSVTFRVWPGGEAFSGTRILRAVVTGEGGRRFTEDVEVIDYPHIQENALVQRAEITVSRMAVDVDRSLRVGYVMGSGDAGAEALRQLGMDVSLLGQEEVGAGAFDPFDVLVLGVRAYETRPDLVGANARLLEWVRTGGTLLVQYNQYEFSGAGLAPHPVRIRRPHDRVTDEGASVTLLDPDAPVFTRPNRITGADFEGWAQERGLYFLGEWDEAYTPLLEMADPGEDPKRGGLLVTPLGDGLWIYSGIAFFRQFPEGVSGAYRLFANLVSLRGEEWRGYARDGFR